MTFVEANKLALDGDVKAFGIKTADHLCYTCTRNRKCMACIRYYGEIITCNFYKVKTDKEKNK